MFFIVPSKKDEMLLGTMLCLRVLRYKNIFVFFLYRLSRSMLLLDVFWFGFLSFIVYILFSSRSLHYGTASSLYAAVYISPKLNTICWKKGTMKVGEYRKSSYLWCKFSWSAVYIQKRALAHYSPCPHSALVLNYHLSALVFSLTDHPTFHTLLIFFFF